MSIECLHKNNKNYVKREDELVFFEVVGGVR